MKTILLSLLILLSNGLHSSYAQIDSLKIDLKTRNNNPLPPGPSTISGTLIDQYGNIIQGAKLTVKYPDGKQRSVDTFTSNESGIFVVYIFRYDQPYIDLEIVVGEKVCKRIRYNQPGQGTNLGHYTEKIVCKIKKRSPSGKKKH